MSGAVTECNEGNALRVDGAARPDRIEHRQVRNGEGDRRGKTRSRYAVPGLAQTGARMTPDCFTGTP